MLQTTGFTPGNVDLVYLQVTRAGRHPMVRVRKYRE